MLLLAFLVVGGCTDQKRDPPRSDPAPQATPSTAPDAKRAPEEPAPAAPVPPRPEAAPQRPKQEPSPSPAAEPPAIVPEARKPESAPPPKDEVKPAPKEAAQPARKEAAKPVATESKKAVVSDVVVLTGSPLGGVRLEHELHAARAGNTCATCHHASKPEKPLSAPQQACSDCHTKVAAAPMKTRYQAAFHNPTAQAGTCIDCHKTESAKGKKAPLKCVDCHKKDNT